MRTGGRPACAGGMGLHARGGGPAAPLLQCPHPRPRPRPLPGPPHRLIDSEVLPVLKQSSLAGSAEFRTQMPLLRSHPHAVDILIDVLSDRGFR